MDFNEVHSFGTGEIRFLDKDILLIKYYNRGNIPVETITASRDKRKELIGDNPYYPIIDCRDGFVSFSNEAKTWVAVSKESSKIRVIDIILVSGWATKIEAKLYLKFFKPINPTHIVSSLDAALEVVKNHKVNLK